MPQTITTIHRFIGLTCYGTTEANVWVRAEDVRVVQKCEDFTRVNLVDGTSFSTSQTPEEVFEMMKREP